VFDLYKQIVHISSGCVD